MNDVFDYGVGIKHIGIIRPNRNKKINNSFGCKTNGIQIIGICCPALTKLALDLHVNFCLFVCMFVCLSVCLFVCLSVLFFKASNLMIYWLLTVVLAPYLSD